MGSPAVYTIGLHFRNTRVEKDASVVVIFLGKGWWKTWRERRPESRGFFLQPGTMGNVKGTFSRQICLGFCRRLRINLLNYRETTTPIFATFLLSRAIKFEYVIVR